MSIEAWLGDDRRLPSWVPDWRWSEAIILAEPICPHRAHGESAAELEIVQEEEGEADALMIRVRGVDIDAVDACSRQLFSRDFYGEKTPDQPSCTTTTTTIERLWRAICGKGSFNLDDGYRDGQAAAFFAFMQTLSNGCVQAAAHDCRSYHEVPDGEWLRKAAKYIVETLGALGHVSEGVRRAAGGTERESGHEEWSRWATSASEGRVFARTEREYYVLGPAVLEASCLQ